MSQSNPSQTPPRREVAPGERHTAPFRKPQLSGSTLGLVALWLGGVAFGTVAPAFVVPPTQDSASTSALLTAFGLTVVGVLIMVLACLLLYRRAREGAVLVFAVVPTGVLLAGGMMLLGTKLFG